MEKISYSAVEKKYWPKFRDGMNHIETPLEVASLFSSTVASILNEVDSELNLRNEEVIFHSHEACTYEFHSRLNENIKLKTYFDESDIGNIIDRFAKTASNKEIHLNKHLEKTKLKIKRH